MRLTPEQRQAIVQAVSREAGATAEVFVFGSRLDPRAKGGDVDLLIETDEPMPLLHRARLTMELETLLHAPVDVVVHARPMPPTPFQRIARAQASKLEAPR
jgi:predicted nucleotidyltransferase